MKLSTFLTLKRIDYQRGFTFALVTFFLISFVFMFLDRSVHFILAFDLFISLSILFFRINLSSFIQLILVVLYLFYNVSFVLLNYGPEYLRDLFITIKFLIYFSILLCIYRQEVISRDSLNRIVNILLFLFMVKYVIMRVLGEPRPSLYTENNFELCFLSILYIVNVYSGYSSKFKFLILVSIILISGSRSAVLGLFLIYLYEFKPLKGSIVNLTVKLIFLGMLLGILGFVIMSRMTAGGVEEVDRYVFLMAFIQSVKQFSFLELLIGAPPLTALAPEICQRLEFYQPLFSSVDPNTCYPVILHSFWFRIILEHGIVFTSIFLILIFKVLLSKGFSVRISLYVLALLGINGLSVSSYNSSIIFMALIIISLMKRPQSTNKLTRHCNV